MKSILRPITARPWISTVVVVVVVLIAVGGFWLMNRSPGGDPSATRGTSTRLVSVSTGTIKEAVSASGTIEPAADDALSFSSAGMVTAVNVAEGDRVTKGQPLGTIDSAALKASLAEAKSSLAAAQARVASDEDDSAVTGTQLAADKASVTAAKGQVSSAKMALAGATITSPIDGVVAAVDVTVGQQVGSSGGASTGSSGASGSGSGADASGGFGDATSNSSAASSSSSAFEVISTGSWLVDTTVDDTEVGQVAKGDQAQITTDGASSTVYGTVDSVAVVASSSSGSASYPVVVDVTGSPVGIHAGATATVSIIYKQLSNVLTVPTLAVHTNGSSSYVDVSSDGKQTTRTIVAGLSSGGSTQVKSGLTAGEQVVEQTLARPGAANRTGSTTRGGGFSGGGFSGGGGFGGGGFGGAGFGGGLGGS